MIEHLQELEQEIWAVLEVMEQMHVPLFNSCYDSGKLPHITDDMLVSVGKFLQKLPLAEVKEAMEIACKKKTYSVTATKFRYFCAICWNKIYRRETAEMAISGGTA